MGGILGFILLYFLYFPKNCIWYLWMATPCTFSLQIHICFPLGNFLLSGSSQSVNANYFPLYWEIREPGSQTMGGNAMCCLPSRCDTAPQHPLGWVRPYEHSLNANSLFSLLAVFLRLCFCKKCFITFIVLSILASAIIRSSLYYDDFPVRRATCFLPYLLFSSSWQVWRHSTIFGATSAGSFFGYFYSYQTSSLPVTLQTSGNCLRVLEISMFCTWSSGRPSSFVSTFVSLR